MTPVSTGLGNCMLSVAVAKMHFSSVVVFTVIYSNIYKGNYLHVYTSLMINNLI